MKKSVIIAIAIILITTFLLVGYFDKRSDFNPASQDNKNSNNLNSENPTQEVSVLEWKEKGVAISGKYADAEIVNLENRQYRMYYTPEPEVSDFRGQVYSAISSDGISWTQESGERKQWATFPSVIKLADGYRMYFQNSGEIKSAFSEDGLVWKDDAGTRINKENNAGLNLENVASPTVIKTNNNYIIVYRGTINEKYSSEVPNSETQLFLWATSDDGLTFEKKGIALDSRNSDFSGLLDGPEFVKWGDEIRLYFWSYKGVYHVVYENQKFSDEEFDFTNSDNPQNKFPENPPGDPTLEKINNKWFMYYGQHSKGIYYANLEQ